VLIVYDTTTLDVISVSGFRMPADAEDIDNIALIDGLPDGQAEMRIYDFEEAAKIWASHDAGAKIEVVRNEQGNAVEVKPLTPIAVKAAPSPAFADEIVEVTGILPSDTQDTQVAFQVEDGSAISEDVVDGQASHAYVFTSPGTYRIQVSSVNHGRAVAEVVVQ
jgi:hypothetical protein